MKSRDYRILEWLLNKEASTYSELSRAFNVSERSIRLSLDEIQYFLSSHTNLSLVKRSVPMISIEGDPNSFDKSLLFKDEWGSYRDGPSRLSSLFLLLVLEPERLTNAFFEDYLQVSKSTIHGDMRKLRETLQSKNIWIDFDQKHGLRIRGDEYRIRSCFVEQIRNSEFEKDFFQSFEQYYPLTLDIVRRIEKQYRCRFLLTAFQTIFHFICVSLYRMDKGYMIEQQLEIQQESCLEEKLALEKVFDCSISLSEWRIMLDFMLHQPTIQDSFLEEGYKVETQAMVTDLLEELSHDYQIDLLSSDSLKQNLSLHLQTMLGKSGLQDLEAVSFDILRAIKSDYSDDFKRIGRSMKKLPLFQQYGLCDDTGISLITIHIITGLNHLKKQVERQLDILVLCHIGIGSSFFLKSNLQKQFEFMVTIGTLEDSNQLDKYDMVLTTAQIPFENTDCLQVSPYLTGQDIARIQEAVDRLIVETLYKNYQHSLKGGIIMLEDLLSESFVVTNGHADNWEEAVSKAGDLLIKNKTVESLYVENMIQAVHDFGPYIVIAQGIALAHASSKEGVHQISMSLLTLAEPVPFGSKLNDPVHAVFTLATTDHDSHLTALSELVRLLGQEDFLQALKENNKETILQIIHKGDN